MTSNDDSVNTTVLWSKQRNTQKYVPLTSTTELLGKLSTFEPASISSSLNVWNGLQHCVENARANQTLFDCVVCITKYLFPIELQLGSSDSTKNSDQRQPCREPEIR